MTVEHQCRHCGMRFERLVDLNVHEEFDHADITFESRRLELVAAMPGYDGLIDAVQGMLAGWSIATGEIWHTASVADTLDFTYARLDELNAMVRSWGLEK